MHCQLWVSALAVLCTAGCQSADVRPWPVRPVQRLRDLDPEQQRAALSALAVAPDAEMLPEVTACLQSRDAIVRHQAATLLGEQVVRTAVRDLIAALGDEAGFVREGVHIALRRITQQSIEYDPYAGEAERARGVRAWSDWWLVNGAIFLPAEVNVGPPR